METLEEAIKTKFLNLNVLHIVLFFEFLKLWEEKALTLGFKTVTVEWRPGVFHCVKSWGRKLWSYWGDGHWKRIGRSPVKFISWERLKNRASNLTPRIHGQAWTDLIITLLWSVQIQCIEYSDDRHKKGLLHGSHMFWFGFGPSYIWGL